MGVIRIGVDIGSTAAKTAVLDDGELVHAACVPTGFSSVDAAERIRTELASAGYDVDDASVVATGYGRVSVPYAGKTVTEITCHGKGAAFLFGPDCVVVDIGGQDTKAIVVRAGKVVKFAMNDKCSAGTGKFLEIMANRMGVSQDELSRLARQGNPTEISSLCTVFAESEVISLIGEGKPREDIAWGVIESVAGKVTPLIPNADDLPCFLTGGLCDNEYLIERLSLKLGKPIGSSPQARFAGALGAALSTPLTGSSLLDGDGDK